MNFHNTSVLITGGSRGLGLALGQALAEAGARVVLVARHQEELDLSVAEIRRAGGQAYGIAADIGDKQAIYRIAGQAVALIGPIDVLIHNASTLGPTPMPLLVDTDCEDLERVLQVNTVGPFRLTKVIAGAMSVRQGGVVVHISSDAAVDAYPGWGAYGASKAALDHMSRTWATEMPGVRFFSVDPGEMDTEMHAKAMPDADRATLADPRLVATRIVAMIANEAQAPTGVRLRVDDWPPTSVSDVDVWATSAATQADATMTVEQSAMKPARMPPARRDQVRLLVVDPTLPAPPGSSYASGAISEVAFAQLATLLGAGDVLVINDAATLPASISGHTQSGAPIELRLCGPAEAGLWRAVLLGAGTWRTPTEHRPDPPAVAPGDHLHLRGGLGAVVTGCASISPRLLTLAFDCAGDALWQGLYAAGTPIQYAYLQRDLDLWAVQTAYGTRPWAAEMPSAGRALTGAMLLALRQRGVTIASLTHAAGLSATGVAAIDRALPLPERFDIPAATVGAIAASRARGGRVIAVGTTVVRALEGSAVLHGGTLHPGEGMTDLVIGAGFQPTVVHGLLTGMHEPHTSHFRLLEAFAPAALLHAAWQRAIDSDYRGHEFGDLSLIAPRALAHAAASAPSGHVAA